MQTEIKLRGIPIFRIDDVETAKRFYLEFLGFTLDWEHYFEEGAPVYLQVSRDGLQLQLSQNERFRRDTIIYVHIEGLEALHRELSLRAGTWRAPEVSSSPWGTRQMELEDPFGNLLRFNEPAT